VHAEAATPLLCLAASHTIGEFLLPGWLARFRLAAPEVRPQVAIINSEAVLAALREGDADIGFVEGHANLHKGLVELTLASDEIVAVVASEHPWARRRRLPARALADEPFLTRERGSGTRAVALTALAERGVELEPALEAASNESLKRAVLDGGFTLLSRLAVEAEVRAGAPRTARLRR
jgi:DNA-binding transcriptional LysR family regulator